MGRARKLTQNRSEGRSTKKTEKTAKKTARKLVGNWSETDTVFVVFNKRSETGRKLVRKLLFRISDCLCVGGLNDRNI